MGKKKPLRRKSFPQFPSISLGGGGEGFSIPIIKDLYTDRCTTPPPPEEADTRKGIPQSKLNGMGNSPPTFPQSNLEGVDKFPTQVEDVPRFSPQPEDVPQFFSHYSKQLPKGEELSAQPYSSYPQCRPHPLDVVRSVRQVLKSRGVIGTRELINQYPLEIILDAINSVDDMISVGVEVRDPPRLIMWRLKRIAANGQSDG